MKILPLGITGVAFAAALSASANEAVANNYRIVPPNDAEPVRIGINDSTETSLSITIRFLQNVGADKTAPLFAIHTGRNLPTRCGDFSDVAIPLQGRKGFNFNIDLQSHPEMIDAIENEGCVLVANRSS